MPGMSGVKLAEQLGRTRPDMKVLYISGYTSDTIVDRGMVAPGINLLTKPFGSEDLAEVVRRVLDAPADPPEA